MQYKTDNRTQIRLYDSIEDMVAVARKVRKSNVITNVKSSDWIGREFESWATAYQAASSEWADGIATIERMVNELADVALPQPKSRKRRTRFDEAGGDEVDYDRLRSGQDFWRLTRREATEGPSTLTLFVDMATPGFREADSILWRGAAAIALAIRLEAVGYRVELWAVSKTKECYQSLVAPHQCDGVCLKRTSDPLDLSTLANAVSGWFYRTIALRAKGASSEKYGSGAPEQLTSADLDHFSCDERRDLIAGVWDREAAIDLIRHKLAELAG